MTTFLSWLRQLNFDTLLDTLIIVLASLLCITVHEMSKRLHISRSAAYQLASAASFYPAFRLGKRVLIRVAELEKWLAEQA